MKDFLKKLAELNTKYIEGNEYSDPDTDTMFRFHNHDTNVILSSPHSTKSVISNKEKGTDICTGPIVELIGEEYDKSYIVKPIHIFREETIFDFVVSNKLYDNYFLDIHGMKMENRFELAVGIGHFDEKMYEEELDYIKKLSGKYRLSYAVNNPNYTGRPGLTGKLQKHTGKAKILQLEWRADFRNFYEYPDNVLEKTIPFIVELSNFVEKIK